MNQVARCALAFVTVISGGTALADDRCDAPETLIYTEDATNFCVPVSTDWSVLRLPAGSEIRGPQDPVFYYKEDGWNRIHIQARTESKVGQETVYRFFGLDGCATGTITFRVAKTVTKHDFNILIQTKAEAGYRVALATAADRREKLARENAALRKQLAKARQRIGKSQSLAAQFRDNMRSLKQELARAHARETSLHEIVKKLRRSSKILVQRARLRDAALHAMTQGQTRRSTYLQAKVVSTHTDARIRLGLASWDVDGDYLLLPFDFALLVGPNFPLAGVRVHEIKTQAQRDTVVPVLQGALNSLGTDVLGVAPTGKRIRGVIAIKTPNTHDAHILEFHDNGGRSFDVHIESFLPKTIAIVAQPLTNRERWTSQLRKRSQWAVGPLGLIGLIRVEQAKDQDASKFAGLVGGGLRVEKGMTEAFAFALETSGGRSAFVTLDNERRRATFGRVVATAHLRLGEDDIPHAWIGAGIQGTHYSGSGSWTALTGVWTIGAGYDKRMGGTTTIGANVQTSIIEGNVATILLSVRIKIGVASDY